MDPALLAKQVSSLKQTLIDKWDAAIGEDDSFEFLFGDPKETPYAVLLTVYYDEDGEVAFEIEHPGIEDGTFSEEESFSDRDLRQFRGIVEEALPLLDTSVPEFAQAVYNALYAFDSHPSLQDLLYEEYESLKAKQKAELEQRKRKEAWAREAEEQQAHINKLNLRAGKRKLLWQARQNRYNVPVFRNMQEYYRSLASAATDSATLTALSISAWKDANNRCAFDPTTEYACPRIPLVMPQLAREKLAESKASLRGDVDEGLWNYLELAHVLEQPYFLYSNSGLTKVPVALRLLTHLQELNLSENQLTSVPHEVASLPNLKRLFLHTNALTALPDFSKCKNLELLDVHNNLLPLLPAGLGACVRLQSVDAEKNRIRSMGDICNAPKLQYLNLAFNLIKIIPGELVQLQDLQYLRLQKNPIVNLPPHIYHQGMAAVLTFLTEHTALDDQSQPSSIRSDFFEYYKSGHLTDLTVVATGDNSNFSIQAHSTLFASRIPAIKRQIETSRTSDNKTLYLDISKEDLEILVKYVYSDFYDAPTVPKLPEQAIQSDMEMATLESLRLSLVATWRNTLLHVVELSQKFNLPHLKFMAERALGVAKEDPKHPTSTLLENFKSLYGAEVGKDIHFKCSAEPEKPMISAHKVVLCARSQYLRSLLTGGLLESTQNVVDMHDISHDSLKSIVEFCYTDDVAELNGDTIMELMVKARLFGLDRLLAFVESVVGYSLDVANVTSILSTAALLELSRLAKATKFFVLTHWTQVTTDPSWQELDVKIRSRLVNTAVKWGIIADAQNLVPIEEQPEQK